MCPCGGQAKVKRAFNTRLTEWEVQVSQGLDGGESGVWASCVWDNKTKRRHLDVRYFTAKGKPTGHYVLADVEQASTLKRIFDRFLEHVDKAPEGQPMVVDEKANDNTAD